MTQKTIVDYAWVLKQLRDLYLQLNISHFDVIIIDMKKNLMRAIDTIFSDANHFLCLWHINTNVLANCKRDFADKDGWNAFFDLWKKIMYSSSEKKYSKTWRKFCQTYNSFHSNRVEYLKFIYINEFNHRFVKCFINWVLHFNTTTSSRDESEHAMLKRRLRSSIEDLKTMMNDINLLLINELHNHLLIVENAKIRFSMRLNKLIFQQVASYVVLNVLKMILDQYDLFMKRFTILSFCTHVFIIIIDLSCNHKIQKRLYEEDFILLEDIHNHWRYVKRKFLSVDRINWSFQIWTKRFHEFFIKSTKFANDQISRLISRCRK
jgi:hypothetical protein